MCACSRAACAKLTAVGIRNSLTYCDFYSIYITWRSAGSRPIIYMVVLTEEEEEEEEEEGQQQQQQQQQDKTRR